MHIVQSRPGHCGAALLWLCPMQRGEAVCLPADDERDSLTVACLPSQNPQRGRRVAMGFALSTMALTSPAFTQGTPIPRKHSGEGEDVSPPLEWSDAPEGTRSFALICHDPDAPLVLPGAYGFVHWVVYNIPASVTGLPEGASGYTAGSGDFGKTTYGGPMPPNGHGVHHYYFWLFALDEELDLEPGLTLSQLLERIEPHTLGMNRLVGTYERA
jgi:Raf kinase inhibitor-like YbhB/YbcL family protein